MRIEFERGSQPTCSLQTPGGGREAQWGGRCVASILGIFVEELGSERVENRVQVGVALAWASGLSCVDQILEY
jgi:hypothetical protein